MRDRALLLLYLGVVVAGSLVHDGRVLAAALALVLVSAGPGAWRLTRRMVFATGPFLLAIAVGRLAFAWAGAGGIAWPQLAVLGLRVLLLAALAFRLLPAVSLPRALAFSPTLRFALVLATSQVLAFRRLFGDFRLALQARTPQRVGPRTAVRPGAATSAWFLRRAEHDATTMTEALDARGFFLDRD